MKGISVVVCCYNSAQRIEPTLEHVSKQVLGEINAEVVLVNNNSSDDTVAIAAAFWNKLDSKITLNIVEEVRPGLSHARHTGIMNTVYDFVLFCDDDNWLSENYLYTAYEILNANQNIGAVGGMGIPKYQSVPPKEIEAHVTQYAVGPQADRSGDVTFVKGYLYGAGLVIRKASYMHLLEEGFTFKLSDRIGTVLTSGGDFELCQALILRGDTLYYDESMQFYHYLPTVRLNTQYLIKMNKGFGYSMAFLYPYIYLSTSYKHKGKSFYYIFLKQSYKMVVTAIQSCFGLRSLDYRLRWIRERTAWSSLYTNYSIINKLCQQLPNQSWVKRK